MQTRTIGWLIAAALLLIGLGGCRNLPRGGGLGFRKGPEVRTIAGNSGRSDRPAVGDRAPSTISSRVDPPTGEERPGQIIGKVVDDRGVPVANARVRLAVDGAPGGREVEGTTNRSGQFLLKGLRPGEEYTVIAEWDDGREFLLGRSSISAPADEVRIRVASSGGAIPTELGSGTRDERSRVALFDREPRELDVDLDREERPRSSPSPRQPEPVESDRSRSQWTPSDSVRRASLDPERDDPWPVDRPARRPSKPDPDLEFPASTLGSSSKESPEQGEPRRRADPSPEATAPPSGLNPLPDRDEPTRSTVPPSGRPASIPDQERRYRGQDVRLPTVRRFEPEAGPDRERLDPPLLMSDAPPLIEDREGEDTAAWIDQQSSIPGSLQLAPLPAPGPSPEFVTEEELVPEDPEDGGSDSAPWMEPESGPEPQPDAMDVLPAPMEVLPAPIEDLDLSSTFPEPDQSRPQAIIAELPETTDEVGPEAAPSRSFRWSDLPAPGRLIGLDEGGSSVVDEGSAPDASGPGRWAAGLMKMVRRDREPGRTDPAVRPVVRFDADRNRLDDFTLPDLNGRPYRLRDSESEFILLCFWGTWCDPCLAAMPHLDELQEQFGPNRLRVVSIAYERDGEGGPKSVMRAVRRLGLDFPVLLAPADGSCPVASSMDVQYYPTLILLDREGRVVHRETGATSEKLMKLDRAIAAAMDESIMTISRR